MVLRYYASAFPMACMLSFFTFCVYRLLLKFTQGAETTHSQVKTCPSQTQQGHNVSQSAYLALLAW